MEFLCPVGGAVDPDVVELGQHRGVKRFLEVPQEHQVGLVADLVGPDERGAGLAEMVHGEQEFVQEVVVIDHVGRQHVVVAMQSPRERLR